MKKGKLFYQSSAFQKSKMQSGLNSQYRSVTTEDRISLQPRDVESEKFQLKSVIFLLAIRKSVNNMHTRHLKFSFYLIRSLFKETKICRRRSVQPTPTVRRKDIVKIKILKRLHENYKKKKDFNQKYKFIKFCKQFERVKLVKIRRIECVRTILTIFKKKIKITFLEFRGKCRKKFEKVKELKEIVRKIEKIIVRKILTSIVCNRIVLKQFAILYKPKQNLPIMKIVAKAKLSNSPSPESTCKQKKSLFLQKIQKKATEKCIFYQQALLHLRVLTRNHILAKKRCFQKLFTHCRSIRKVHLMRKGYKLTESLQKLIGSKYDFFIKSLKSFEISKSNLNFLVQTLNYIFYKSSMNHKAYSLLSIFQSKRKLNQKAIKSLMNLSRLLNSKVFNRSFFAFMLLKSFKPPKKPTLNPKKTKEKFNAIYALLQIFDCHKYRNLFFTYTLLKSSKNPVKLLTNALSKVHSRVSLYNKLIVFKSLKSKHYDLLRASKIFYLLKQSYTKSTAYSFM